MKRSVTSNSFAWMIAGTCFAALWASASTATKIGLRSAQPLVIALVRFGMAAVIMLLIAHGIRRQRWPSGKEWIQITIYGFLNITLYLGCYVIAMQTITAGIGALAVAANPVFISFLSVFFLKKRLNWPVVVALLVCSAGVLCAAWPLFATAAVTTKGLLILLFSMFTYSVAAIYFSMRSWKGLSLLTINGWQTLIGGLLLAPATFYFYVPGSNRYDTRFWGAVTWLAIPVSIGAVLLWLWLLQRNTVRAKLWLFLCPLFGFAFAAWLVSDPISIYTIMGVALVILGLILSRLHAAKTEIIVE